MRYRPPSNRWDEQFEIDYEQNLKDIEKDITGVQKQIDVAIVEGDSSPAADQARLDAKGILKESLKTRLDDDYNEVVTQLDDKVDKGGAGQITWSMAAQDFREQITGGNTAVVGIDSVLETNLVNGAATFSKRSRLGELATIVLGGSTDVPNIDLPNKKIVFSNTFYVFIGKKRYTVTGGVTIDYTAATQSTPNPVIYFDTATSTFIARPQNNTDSSMVPESCVLFAFLVFKGGTTVLNDVFINCRYTINGMDSNVFFMNESAKNSVNMPLGELPLITVSSSGVFPNLDTNKGTINFPSTFFIFHRNKRFTVNATTLNFGAEYPSKSGVTIWFDTLVQSLYLRDQSLTTGISNDSILIGVVYLVGTEWRLNINSEYTINGMNPNVLFMNESAKNSINMPLGELPLITVSSSGAFPNLDTNNRTINFPSTFFIFHRNKRFTVNTTTLNFGVEYPSKSGVTIWFDTLAQSLYLRDQSLTTGISNDSILIGIVYLVGTEWRLNINSEYTINGKPRYMPFEYKDNEGGPSYQFSLDKVYGSASDSNVPGIGDAESPFNYTNDNHGLVYSLFDQLAQANPNYISKRELGLAYNNLPVNEYTFTPLRPEHASLKPYPKILIGAAVHGGEGMAVTALYYMFKRICEEWKTDERLEYLRHNINFCVVPLRNPGSYNEKLYVYPNGVNINRNFSYGWDSSSDTTKGPTPFSELETQIQRDWMMENQDALFQIDCHVRGGRQSVEDGKTMWLSCSPNDDHAQIAGHTIETMNKRWHKKYPQLSGTDMVGYFTTGEANGTLRSYAYKELGISTITWEGFSRSTTFTNIEDKDVVQMNVDYMIQLVLEIVKKYQ